MNKSGGDRQFHLQVKGELLGEERLDISRSYHFAEVFFAVFLIPVMVIAKLRRFHPEVLQIGKPVFIPHQVLKASIKALDMAVTPRFIERDKDHLNPEIQTKPDQFAKGLWVVQTTSERRFVIDLQKTRNAIHLPILYEKGQDAVCVLCIELFEICLAGTDINTVDRYDFAVSADMQGCNQIQLVQVTRVLCIGPRVINGLLLMVGSVRLLDQAAAFENTVDGGQTGLVIHAFSIKILMNANGTAKGVFGVRLVAPAQPLPGTDNCSPNSRCDLVRPVVRLRGLIEKPLLVIGLASLDPLVDPVTRPVEFVGDIKYCLTDGVQFKTTLSKKNLIISCMTFLDIQGLLMGFTLDIKCSRCPDTAMFTMS
jgi:hypothetical protein